MSYDAKLNIIVYIYTIRVYRLVYHTPRVGLVSNLLNRHIVSVYMSYIILGIWLSTGSIT